MNLSSFIPRAGSALVEAQLWISQVSAILSGGLSLADQSRVRSFTFNDASPPPTVTVDVTASPAAVILLSAVRSGQPTISGAAVTWRWAPSSAGGAILVTAIAGLASAVDYDVKVWIVRS